MKIKHIVIGVGLSFSLAFSAQVFAESGDVAFKKRLALSQQIKKMKNMRKKLPVAPPSGLFGVYALPDEGQYITGVNYQRHEFSGLLQGSNSVSSADITHASTGAANQFYGNPGQPATLRVVPSSAKADVVMPFINYTVDDKISLVAVAPLIKKTSTLETYKADGSGKLGNFTVNSKGLGDVKFGALYKAYNSEDRKHNVIIDAVLSAPTGSITETDVQLAPNNTTPTKRLGHGMQLGSGTWDALVGAAYWGKEGKWGYGAQYLATLPLESKNSENWRYGDKHELTAWTSYSWEPTLVSSLRLRGEHQDAIHDLGLDASTYGPGLGAQVANYGGKIIEAGIGVNWMYAPAKNISIEYLTPISQDRNGVQAEKDSAIAISWRHAFF